MRYFRLSLAALAVAVAAACSDQANPAATMQPRFDGGGMVGSGNVSDTTTVSSGSTGTTTATETTIAVAPGGGTFGSGH